MIIDIYVDCILSVQKRTPERCETTKSVIPPVVEEESELQFEKERYMTSSTNVENFEKNSHSSSDSLPPSQSHEKRTKQDTIRPLDSLKSCFTNNLSQVLDESHSDAHDLLSSKLMGMEVDNNRSRTTSLSKNSEDDPYRR